MGTPASFVVIRDSWFATDVPSPGYTITGIPMAAQLYIHSALSAGRWMQPWLWRPCVYCEPGPSVESGCQLASWNASPVLVKNAVHCTTVSGYQCGEPLGQGDWNFQGWSLWRIFIGPKSVPKSLMPRMPVVTALSMTSFGPSNAHTCWSLNDTMTDFAGRPVCSAWWTW